ncbi:MAG: hypothetical protein IKW13_02015, partial [Thermoguttaceae bacterium]|nr:hypothetical protein [Thermoguttaceae bacterium]
SDRDYEERFWPFLLRFETLIAGVVREASRRLGSATDADARAFFEAAFARCLDVGAGVVPLDYWARVELPSVAWYRAYLDAELPEMIAEARRLATEEIVDADPVDRVKIRRLAHQSATFQTFLLGAAPQPDESPTQPTPTE